MDEDIAMITADLKWWFEIMTALLRRMTPAFNITGAKKVFLDMRQ